MKKIKMVLTVTALLINLLLFGCAVKQTVSLGQEIALKPGQEMFVKDEALSIKFVDVQSDSR